jgi:hypothetical protein
MVPEDPLVRTTAFWLSLFCLSSLEPTPLVAQLHLICLFPSHLPIVQNETRQNSALIVPR